MIKITPRQKKRLARYKNKLRDLSSNKVSEKIKRKFLSQKGGGGGAALVAVLVPFGYRCDNWTIMKRMVLIPEEKLMQYEQQKGGATNPYINIVPYTHNTGWDTPQYGFGKK